jgi:outer membrane receptor protein involved in Fe transport
VTLSVKNAFDRLLYDTFADSAFGAPVQPGRVVAVTARYNF